MKLRYTAMTEAFRLESLGDLSTGIVCRGTLSEKVEGSLRELCPVILTLMATVK